MKRSSQKAIVIFCSCLILIWFLLYINFYKRLQQQQLNSKNEVSEVAAVTQLDGQLVTFKACHNFAVQRMSIVYGILLAIHLKKTLILPKLPMADSLLASDGGWMDESYVPFSKIYDIDTLKIFLKEYNIEVWEIDEILKIPFHQPQCEHQDFQSCLKQYSDNGQNVDAPIDFGCTYPSKLFTKNFLFQNENLIKQIFENLSPSLQYDSIIQKLITSVKSQSDFEKYNVIHLRAENEFVSKCKNIHNIGLGEIRNNCIQNQEPISFHLLAKNFQKNVPIYISSGTPIPESRFYSSILQDLKQFGFSSAFDLFHNKQINGSQFPVQIRQLIDYFVAIEAEKFAGNSQSFFSELLILERQFFGKFGSYYNSGDIPSSNIIPFYKIPLVIYSKCENFDFFKSVTLVALRSGVYFGNVDLYLFCLSNLDSRIQEQLKSLDVKIIQQQQVEKFVQKQDELGNILSISGIVMLGFFEQYNHVFFIGPKTFIRKPIDLGEFNTPLPDDVFLFFSEDDSFSGLMVVNNFFIRKGFSRYGLKFIDELQQKQTKKIRNDKLLQPIHSLNLNFNPGIIVNNLISISDLEVYLVSGFCSLKKTKDCKQIFENGCQYIIEFLLLSEQPQFFPRLLAYCNRFQQNLV